MNCLLHICLGGVCRVEAYYATRGDCEEWAWLWRWAGYAVWREFY